MTDKERETNQSAEMNNPEVAEMVVDALAEGIQYARARYDELSPEERELLRKQEEILSKRGSFSARFACMGDPANSTTVAATSSTAAASTCRVDRPPPASAVPPEN